jgi:glutamate synthase (NADPH) large chain
VVIAALLGAEEFGFATAPLITLGCIMMRKCHLNTCPVGIATQDPVLRKKFTGKPEHVSTTCSWWPKKPQIMAELGFRTMDEMIGRVDCWRRRRDPALEGDGLDLTPILTPAQARIRTSEVYARSAGPRPGICARQRRSAGLPARRSSAARRCEERRCRSSTRTAPSGTILSHESPSGGARRGCPTTRSTSSSPARPGRASARSWPGVTLELEGDANDYVGKGSRAADDRLSAAEQHVRRRGEHPRRQRGAVRRHRRRSVLPRPRGRAVLRPQQRRQAVIEGVGDHGCEYMTGGRVVILGPTGRNFAAGMSGGIAYVWDRDGDFITRCNLGTVELER